MATSLAGPGMLVVLGVALHGLIAGAAVAAPVVGQPMLPGRLLLLAAIVAGPSVGGIIVGTRGWGRDWNCWCSRVAAGTLIYVLRELLRAGSKTSAPSGRCGRSRSDVARAGAELLMELGRSKLSAWCPVLGASCG